MIKKLLLLFILITTFLKGQAQTTFEHNFLGKDFFLYKGALFKLTDDPISELNFTFYSDLKYCQSPFDENVIYPLKNNIMVCTVKDSIMNRIFFVESIVDKTGQEWNETSETDYFSMPLFVLKDTLTGQKIYYKYDKKHEGSFPFNTSKINYPVNYFCEKIEKEKDEFTGELKFNSPIMNGIKISPIIIYKYINKGKAVYYLSLMTYGNTFNINKTGVIILFKDGTKWTRASEIDVDTESYGFKYSAFISLTTADLTIFSTKKIKKFRLYIYDEEVNSSDSDKFKLFTKCIKDTK